LDIINAKKDLKTIFLFILITYILSVIFRYYYIFEFQDYQPYLWNGTIMINTFDGYYYALGAQDILNHTHSSHSPTDATISKVTAFLAKYTPLSFEEVLLWMPVLFSSLLVIPLILIGYVLKTPQTGIIAAFLAPITWVYYERTMAAHYDTDMLNIVLPMFVFLSIIYAFQKRNSLSLLFVSLSITISNLWYPQSATFIIGMLGMAFFYSFFKKKKDLFIFKLLAYSFIPLSIPPALNPELSISLTYKLVILTLFFSIDTVLKNRFDKIFILIFLIISLSIYYFNGTLHIVISKIYEYIIPRLHASGNSLHFLEGAYTIAELQQISFIDLAHNISGHIITFSISALGLVYMIIKKPLMLIALPMIVIGTLSYKLGIRFSIYAAPFYALGYGFFVTSFIEFFKQRFSISTKIQYLLMATTIIFALLPNILHIKEFKPSPTVTHNEAKILSMLHPQLQQKDYVVSWWDYGYPIMYYTKAHAYGFANANGKRDYPISFALMHNQQFAKNTLPFAINFDEHFIDKLTKKFQCHPNELKYILRIPNLKLPKLNRKIFLYIPYRLFDYFNEIAKFSEINLYNGKVKRETLFYLTKEFKQNGNMIDLGNNFTLNLKNRTISIKGEEVPINTFFTVEYDKHSELHIQKQPINPKSVIYVIYLKSYKKFLVVNQKAFNSTMVQLFVFEDYDPRFFRPVILTPYAKVYKLVQEIY